MYLKNRRNRGRMSNQITPRVSEYRGRISTTRREAGIKEDGLLKVPEE
jgi:hypothetical protein